MRNKFYLVWWIYVAIFVPVGIVAIIGIAVASLWKKKDIEKLERKYMEHKADKNILNKDGDEIAKKSAVNYVLYLKVPKPLIQDIYQPINNNNGKPKLLEQEYNYIPITFENDDGNNDVVKNVSQSKLKNIVSNLVKNARGYKDKTLARNIEKCLQEQQSNNICSNQEAIFLYAKEGENGEIFLNNNGEPETKEVIKFTYLSDQENKLTFIPTSNSQNTVNYIYNNVLDKNNNVLDENINGLDKTINGLDKTEILIGTKEKTEDNIEYVDEYGVNEKNIIGTTVLQQKSEGTPASYNYIIKSIDEQPNNVQYQTDNGRNVVIKAKYINNIPYEKGTISFFDNQTGRYIQKNVIFSGQEILSGKKIQENFISSSQEILSNKKPHFVFYTDLQDNEKYCFDLSTNKYMPIDEININFGLTNTYYDLDRCKDGGTITYAHNGEIIIDDSCINISIKTPIEAKILEEIEEEEKKNNEEAKISNDKSKQNQK